MTPTLFRCQLGNTNPLWSRADTSFKFKFFVHSLKKKENKEIYLHANVKTLGSRTHE
jgi:hypothetical protein